MPIKNDILLVYYENRLCVLFLDCNFKDYFLFGSNSFAIGVQLTVDDFTMYV